MTPKPLSVEEALTITHASIQGVLDSDPEEGHENCCGTTDQCCRWAGDLKDSLARLRRDQEAIRKVREEIASCNASCPPEIAPVLPWTEKWLAALDEILGEEG